MLIASVALGALAVALAWPAPILLSRAGWPSRSPAVALVLWQSIALAGGLSMIGALLAYGLIPFGGDLASSAIGLVGFIFGGGVASQVDVWNLLALSGAVLLGGHLLLNLALTVARSEVHRRRHARLVDLLSSPLPDTPGTRLLESPAPVAYCLPGPLRSITVLSAGLVALLDENELRAVVEHERAHLRQRHDIVLIAFRAWHASLPWFPIAYRAQREVGMLVEMLADDRARRVVPDDVLARAIALVASTGVAGTGMSPLVEPEAGSPEQARTRVLRLAGHAPSLPARAEAAIVAGAAALLAVPTALLLGPAVLALLGLLGL